MSVGIERALAALHYLPAGLSAARRDVRRSPWLVALAGSGTCGSREQSSAILIYMLRHFARLLQKLQHRLSWPLNGACVHFVSWGGTTEMAHKQGVSRRFVI